MCAQVPEEDDLKGVNKCKNHVDVFGFFYMTNGRQL